MTVAELKPYETCKDSGVPWLGVVPEHWEVRKLRNILGGVAERNQPDLPLLSVVREKGVILRDVTSQDTNHNFIPDDLTNYKVVFKGQFAMNKMKAWQGSYGVSDYEGIVSPAYYVFDLNSVEGEFFNTAIRSRAYVPFFTQASDGVRIGQWDLSQNRMKEIPFIIPPKDEQTTIVRYLEYMDRRIRRFIHAKQKLIKLLEEQKQAIIHRAVTLGLDPDVPLKPSGVEWLGDIPENWEIRRVKSLSLVKRGASPRPIADQKYFEDNGEYSWVRIADVTASDRYLEKTTQRLSALGQSLSVALEPGSLFLSIAGSVGKPIITHIKCCIHDGFVYFPQFNGNVDFLYHVFAAGSLFARLGKLGTQLNLNTDTVGSICVGWPPEKEQDAIVAFLDDAAEGLDSAISSAKSELFFLQEYRTRLISDLVTGKLDVREAAENLPDKDDEEELLEVVDEPEDNDVTIEDLDPEAAEEVEV